MTIPLEKHITMVKAAVAYRQALEKVRDTAVMLNNNTVSSLATSLLIELNGTYGGHVEFAVQFYSEARVKRNSREKLRQRENRAASGAKPRQTQTAIIHQPVHSFVDNTKDDHDWENDAEYQEFIKGGKPNA